MKRENILSVVVGILLGAGLWIGIAAITGRREAWDGNLLYYTGGLLAAGCVVGFVFRAGWLAGVIGIYTGQIIAMLIKSGGDFGLLPLGLVALAVFTSTSAAGGFISSLARINQKGQKGKKNG